VEALEAVEAAEAVHVALPTQLLVVSVAQHLAVLDILRAAQYYQDWSAARVK
jgi:hypothetical protein